VVGNKYQDIILAHARNQAFVGEPSGPFETAQEINAVCGDEVTVYLQPDALSLKIRYHVVGCALCSASASIMAEQLSLLSGDQGKEIVLRFLSDFPVGRLIEDHGSGIEALFDMRRFPARERCVLLPWQALKRLLH